MPKSMIFQGAAIGAGVLALATGAALADGRFYPDLETTSPLGRYRLEARSPDNLLEPEERERADEFVYTLLDEDRGEVVWEHLQPPVEAPAGGRRPEATTAEGSPVAIWVDDHGHAVARTGRDELLVLAPDGGAPTLRLDLLDRFPEPERSRCVVETKAGPVWAEASHWYFLDVAQADRLRPHGDAAARTYFVVRTWWDRRVVVDVEGGQVLRLDGDPPGPGPAVPVVAPGVEEMLALRAAMDEAERTWAMDVLRRAADASDGGDRDAAAEGILAMIPEITAAAHLAGRLGISEAIPSLRRLESCPYVGRSHELWRQYTMRQTVQLALRRLGETPGDAPSMEITSPMGRASRTGQTMRRPLTAGAKRSDRAPQLRRVQKGMSVRELVAAIGHPDYLAVPWQPATFDYEIDGPDPRTVRVHLIWDPDRPDERYFVSEVETIRPPVWQSGIDRDAGLCR